MLDLYFYLFIYAYRFIDQFFTSLCCEPGADASYAAQIHRQSLQFLPFSLAKTWSLTITNTITTILSAILH